MTHIFRQFAPLTVLLLTGCICESQQSPPNPSKNQVVQNRSKRTEKQEANPKPQSESRSSHGGDHPISATQSQSKIDHDESPAGAAPYPVQIVSQPPPDGWYIAYVFITGIAMLVGIGTLIAIWRQTIATRIAAEAARDSAEGLITAERPWIITVLTSKKGTVISGFANFILSMKNIGQTPAKIIAIRLTAKVMNSSNDLPQSPKYGESQVKNEHMLAPQETWTYEYTSDSEVFLPEEIAAISRKKQHLFCWGIIEYRDTFRPNNKPHETRYCYKYLATTDEWDDRGPSNYINYT